jgi:hypothetical protein
MIFLPPENALYGPLEPCDPPSLHSLELLRMEVGEDLFRGEVHYGAESIYDLNWTNGNDIVANWRLLDAEPDKQHALRAVLESSLSGNRFRRGLKHECPLIDHLMVMTLGRGVDRMGRYGTRLVTSCLKNRTTGHYSPDKVNVRSINPPQAMRQADEFLKHHHLPKLFDRFVARILLFEPADDSVRYVGQSSSNNAEMRREQYKMFFSSVTGHLNRLVKRHRVWSYMVSCEIACRSIKESLYQPHVHAVVWMDPDDCVDWLEYELPADTRLRRPSGMISKWTGIERFVRYLFQTNSIGEVYRREWGEIGIKEFNVATVNAWENMVWLLSGDPDSAPFKRIRFRYLPGRDDQFVHRPYWQYMERKRRRSKEALIEA